jgi:hypothetical protein
VPILKSGVNDAIPNVRLVALKVMLKICNSDNSMLLRKSLTQDVMALTEESEMDLDVNYFANLLYAKLT